MLLQRSAQQGSKAISCTLEKTQGPPRHTIGLRWRQLHTTGSKPVQRLLWAGSVLDQRTASLREVPKDWLLAMGAQADVEQGISFTGLSASPSHLLLSYKTLPPALPVVMAGESSDELEYVNPSGLHKIAAIGRNTFGELGLRFASQESTWGLVSPGFEGAGGIRLLRCGLGSSLIVTNQNSTPDSKSLFYAFGNHTSGQLGLGGPSRPHALSEGGEPQHELYSSPRKITLRFDEEVVVEDVAAGLDHTVVLARKSNGEQAIYTFGVNTDGQLGIQEHRITSTSPSQIEPSTFKPSLPPAETDPIVGVAAGGDTSLLWTASGRIWAWGNSEYAQALVDGKPIERIEVPTEASQAVAEAIDGTRVVDIKLGGSFVVLLTDNGDVFTAGFGALGQGKDNLQSDRPRKILAGASRIHAGLEQASAVVHGTAGAGNRTHLAVWGLNSGTGRLGLGTRKPYPSYMIASRFTADDIEMRVYQPVLVQGLQSEWLGRPNEMQAGRAPLCRLRDSEYDSGIVDVAHGRDAMFVLVEDGVQEKGRWQAKEMR